MLSEQQYRKNIEKWTKDVPTLAKVIFEWDNPETEFCRTGNDSDLNLSFKDEKGNSHFFHSTEGVKKEAYHWFSSLNLDNVSVLYVFGVGLGYHFEAALEWLEDDEERNFIFLEDDLTVIQRLFQTELGSQLLDHKQVSLYYIPEEKVIDALLEHLSIQHFLQRSITSALQFYERQKHDKLVYLMMRISKSYEDNSGYTEFLNLNRAHFCNLYRNLLFLPSSYQGGDLFNQFKGIPAIICGAGPSLDKNFQQLQEINDCALIFAGSTAISALAPGMQQPHFGVGVDPNIFQISRLMMSNAFETPFFYSYRWQHHALRLTFGPHIHVSVGSDNAMNQLIEERLGYQSKKVDSGHNVVNLAIGIAYALGCDPIVLVGVDQAYVKNRSYASTVYHHPLDNWKKDFTTKTPENELLVRRDINGEATYTLWKWIQESNWIAEFAAKHPDVRMINATEGGIGFSGIPNMTLANVMNEYLTKLYDLPVLINGALQQARMPSSVTIDGVIALIGDVQKSLKQCSELCRKVEEGFKQAVEKIKKEEEVPLTLVPQETLLGISELEEELAFSNVLEQYQDVFHFIFEKDFNFPHPNLSAEEKQANNQKRAEKQNEKYRLLEKACHINSSAIQFAGLAYQKDREFFHKGEQKGSQAVVKGEYRCENDVFAIEDSELDIVVKENLDAGELQLKEGKPYRGKCVENYEDDAVKTECYYHEGRFHGPYRYYHKKGQLLGESWYLFGLLHGKRVLYNYDGSIYSIQRYRDGLREGVQEFYYPKGAIKMRLSYADGNLNGEVEMFHMNGTQARSLTYQKGLRQGKEFIWNELGSLIVEAEYAQNLPCGEARQWHTNGNLKKEVVYSQDGKECVVKQWNRKGDLLPPEILTPHDYFDQMNKETDLLTQSLSEVFERFQEFSSAIEQQSAEELEKSDLAELPQTIKDVEEELKYLHTLSSEMNKIFEGGQEKGHEILWKTPMSKDTINLYVQSASNKMAEDMKHIQDALKKALKYISPDES